MGDRNSVSVCASLCERERVCVTERERERVWEREFLTRFAPPQCSTRESNAPIHPWRERECVSERECVIEYESVCLCV